MQMCKPKISLFSLSYSLNSSGSSGASEPDHTKKKVPWKHSLWKGKEKRTKTVGEGWNCKGFYGPTTIRKAEK